MATKAKPAPTTPTARRESRVREITLDVCAVTRGVIAHGVNCQGTMGAGLAKTIAGHFPGVQLVYRRYVDYFVARGQRVDALGRAQIVQVDYELYVANCFTQFAYGNRSGGPYADVNAIAKSLRTAYEFAYYASLPIYLPRIGCGLGGLDYRRDIQPIIERAAEFYSLRVATHLIERPA